MRTPRFLRGWLPVAGKEWRGTLLSPRLLIIAGILALAVLAGTYAVLPGSGGASAPERIGYAVVYYPELNSTRPAMAVFVASPLGEPLSGVEVRLLNVTYTAQGPVREIGGQTNYPVLERKNTDASGWARFERLSERYPDWQLQVDVASPATPAAVRLCGTTSLFGYSGSPSLQLQNSGQWAFCTIDFGNTGRMTLSSVFTDTYGTAQAGASVYILRLNETEPPPPLYQDWTPPGGWEQYKVGVTNTGGYYLHPQPLEQGQYLFRVQKGVLNATAVTGFSASPSPLTAGPDGVLAFSGLSFVPLILPIMALVLAYDSIARERSEGSLDLLLSKPVARLGVALGKLLGVLGSAAIPVTSIILATAALIWARTGQPPTTTFLAAFVGEALFLLLAYTVIFLAISAFSRSLGTALLFSILIFLLFAIFWGLISFLIATLLAPQGSVQWVQIITMMSIFTPTGVYQQLLGLSLRGLAEFGFGGPFGFLRLLPPAEVALAAILWTTVPLAFFLWTMKYRVTEG